MSQEKLSRSQRKRRKRKEFNNRKKHDQQFGHFAIITSPIILDNHKYRLDKEIEIDTDENDEGNIVSCSICNKSLPDHHAGSCNQRCPCQRLHNKNKHSCVVCLQTGPYHDPLKCARNTGQLFEYKF